MLLFLVSFQPRLLHQFVEQTDSQVFLRMRHADMAGPLRVDEDVVGALAAAQNPAGLLHSANQLAAGHGVYRTHG